jgi:hypothetical protein
MERKWTEELSTIALIIERSSKERPYVAFIERVPKTGAMTTCPRFMRPCKSLSLDYRSLFNTSRLVKYKNGLCVPVLIGVPVSKSRNFPEVVLVRRWAVGVLGIWRGGVGWVKGGANGVSLQAT